MTIASSADIAIAGTPFPEWFNSTMVGKPDFHNKVDPEQFCTVFDHVADLWAPEITTEQFVAFFAIFYNETGGTMKPLAELGGPRYCFETSIGGVPGRKRSYNSSPNRLAGDQLVAMGILREDQRAAWNGKVWPQAPEEVYEAAKECDFYKFRGRGLIQTTWRTTYEQQVDPLLLAAGFSASDFMSTADLDQAVLTTPSVYLGMVRAFFQGMPLAFAAVAQHNWALVGTHVSGSTAYGTGVYSRRCSLLLGEMGRAG